MIKHIKDVVQGKADIGDKRSSKWDTVRKNFLKTNSVCAVCGGSEKLEVHHKQPFHLYPDLELDATNLITLCESTTKCHLEIGHLGNWKNFNPNVVEDATKALKSI